VVTDIVLAWDLLEPGAITVFDDYRWMTQRPPAKRPKVAIDAFATAFGPQLTRLEDAHRQLVLRRDPGRSEAALVGNPLVRILELDPAAGPGKTPRGARPEPGRSRRAL
jgi:hypothetical protein